MTSNERFQHLVNSLINFVPHAPGVSPAEKMAVASITY